ncbi:cytochrome c biogenesis heme-transporting ATPase CcmA [Salmonella enterica subsp. enterica]|nr:cytochrome c biogenesis heme-transporting ATPase CcmA [Salmonella enterica]TRN63305.1 cytochrome c biogenesis heme-transporting ATPase CcmA [Salmonella enterica subsp. enterica]
MLEARDLYCERDERTLFRGLSFTVEAGEWVQVTGGNGAGKTTLLRLLTGLARPDGGEVYWQGEPLRRVRDSFHRSLLWIGHQPGIKTRLTARENLHFFHPGMLEARDLYCERDERTLFRGLSFTVEAGEWVQVTGGNGAGKTTLLRLLTGLARPDGGEVYWQGEPLRRVRDSFHRSLLWIGHQPGIKTRLTARENLHFFHPGDGARLPEALAQAGLAGFEDVPVAQLSAGQQRRVALARLWLTRAALWVLDEPFTAIDVNGVARLTRRMAAHTAQGGMVILTTHQPLPGAADTVRRLALTGGGAGL